mmetsp:Transcript_5094/g.9817  ORF Transcript_5094/g.9817 Transcript_5094/m.9817 type:complete len:149 (-) Transcript_5094:796-1242(-)
MVDSRCVMTTTVLPSISRSKACCTSPSLSTSSAEVASSNRRTRGSLRIARAIASLCLCPPDRDAPLSPTSVLYLSGKAEMKPCALACSAASRTSSSVASSFPYRMLSATEQENRFASWDTVPICALSHPRSSCARHTPSTVTTPLLGS